jgi:uncharacterized protein (TIGR00369 family)
MLDPTIIERIRRRIGSAPFANWMGFEMTGVGPGSSELTLELAPHHLNPGGRAHGGVAASLLDSAIGLALRTLLPEGANHATLQLNVTYLRPAAGGRLIARATAVHRGRRIEYGEGTVFDADEHVVARGSATFVVLPP